MAAGQAGRADRGAWLLVSTSAAFEAARARGLETEGLPVASAAEAARAQPGDMIAVYLTDVPGFAATAEVPGEAGAGAAPGGGAGSGDGAHLAIRITAACPKGDYEPAAPLVPHLALAREWPVAEWGAARPGELRPLPLDDAHLLRMTCRARERGSPRPPGAPPTEAERPPKIPSKLRGPKRGGV